MSIFCSLIRVDGNIFHSQSTVKTLESASQLPYRYMWRRYVCWREKISNNSFNIIRPLFVDIYRQRFFTYVQLGEIFKECVVQ